MAMSTTILLSRGDDSHALSVVRCLPFAGWLARLLHYELDTRLSRGEDPDSRVLLSLRAQQLCRPSGRRTVARAIRRLLATARRPPHPVDRRIPIASSEILECESLIEELVGLLESETPADPCGVAKANLLVCEGGSPFYRPAVTGRLRPVLHAVIGSIEPPEMYALT
jgi:hypothetical protein